MPNIPVSHEISQEVCGNRGDVYASFYFPPQRFWDSYEEQLYVGRLIVPPSNVELFARLYNSLDDKTFYYETAGILASVFKVCNYHRTKGAPTAELMKNVVAVFFEPEAVTLLGAGLGESRVLSETDETFPTCDQSVRYQSGKVRERIASVTYFPRGDYAGATEEHRGLSIEDDYSSFTIGLLGGEEVYNLPVPKIELKDKQR